MGMDYAGRRGDWFHLNWTGHGYMARALAVLGADLHEWSGWNDGAYIKAGTCRAWARLLRTGLAAGGWRERQSANGRGLIEREDPVPADGSEPAEGTDLWAMDRLGEYFGYRHIGETQPISPEWAQLVVEFADFLDACGGCRQW